jgi:hypothetical protein
MADEITIQGNLRINNVDGVLPPLTHQKVATFDQTNKEKVSLTIACSTSTAAMDLSGLTAKGWTYFENIGTTNAVIVSIGTNDAFIVPPASGYAVKLVTATTYVAKTAASTSTLVVEGYAD